MQWKQKRGSFHFARHSELPTLTGRGFIPSAFPLYQHLCIQQRRALNWLAYALTLCRPRAQWPLTLCLCKHAPRSPTTDPNSPMDTGRARRECGGLRNWHLCHMAKADTVGWEGSGSVVGSARWLPHHTTRMESGHQGGSKLWLWPSFALNPELRKKLAQQWLASLSNPLCTSLSSRKGLSNPFVGIWGAWLHAWGQIASYLPCGSTVTAPKLQQNPFWLLWSIRKKRTYSCLHIKNTKVCPQIL